MNGQQEQSLLQQEIKVVNVGLELFAHALEEQEVEVVHVAWQPPADGDPQMMELLDKLL